MRSVILALVLCTGSAWGQLVGTNFCTASSRNSNPSCALPAPVTVGNKLIAIVIESDTSSTSYSVTDTLANAFTFPGGSNSPQWTSGFTAAQCGAGADGRNWCFNNPYVAPITTGGIDTVTYVSGGNTPDVYFMYVGEYAGIGSFDVTATTCRGGSLFPCNGLPSGGAQSTNLITGASNSFLFAVAACDVNTGIGSPGCSGFPINSTGTFRANLSASGGCCSNDMRATVFDDLGGPPGTYTETAAFGAATNWVLTVWSFGFTAPATGFAGDAQIL